MDKTNRRQTELCAGEGESLSWVPVESQSTPSRRADERTDRQIAGQRDSQSRRGRKKKISKKKEKGKKKKGERKME